jgi:ABC-type nitrate/sulfonate/bicarbonate transport system substrate-binding protein
MRSFVAGVMEAIAYIRKQPSEAKAVLQKYTRVSDAEVLQHAYDSDTRYMEPVPYPSPEGTKTILEQFGVLGQPAETFLAEFIENRFIKQLSDEGFVRQIYPGGIPTR